MSNRKWSARKKRRKSPTLAKGARMGHPSSKARSHATAKARRETDWAAGFDLGIGMLVE
jgi:hypothetical protein